MTNVTVVGVSYDDHINDDAPEIDSFLADVTRLSPPPPSFPGFEVRAGGRGYVYTAIVS